MSKFDLDKLENLLKLIQSKIKRFKKKLKWWQRLLLRSFIRDVEDFLKDIQNLLDVLQAEKFDTNR